jgi:Tfp pilus assembly protein PilN
MIKINLLDSVTDRPTGIAMMEERVASPLMQSLLLGLTIGGLLFLGAGYDYFSSRSDNAAAQRELENQQRINKQMLAVNKEQEDLQKKTADIQVRIDAIQKLRAAQQGPGPVLHEIKQRFDGVPELYLKSIEQKGNSLTIKGESPNEAAVTRFGQSLEFSSGLFTDLNIETAREVVQSRAGTSNAPPSDDPNAAKPEVVTFTVKCVYNPAKSSQPVSTVANAAPNQVAKN